MTPRGRTNQLLYHAELLLEVEGGQDEHAHARILATREGALALLSLALDSALRELTEHARLSHHGWRELLRGNVSPAPAEVERLREQATQPESWLAVLIGHLDAQLSVDGVRRPAPTAALIATAGQGSLIDELRWCLAQFKEQLGQMRETSSEW